MWCLRNDHGVAQHVRAHLAIGVREVLKSIAENLRLAPSGVDAADGDVARPFGARYDPRSVAEHGSLGAAVPDLGAPAFELS